MAILSLKMDFPGQIGVTPRLGKLFVNDTIAQATSAGFLNSYVKNTNTAIFRTDTIDVAASDDTKLCKVVLTGSSIQLVAI